MPREIDASWDDGIRSLRPDEFGKLKKLVGTVFRPTIVEEYPHVYRPEHAAHLHVVVKDGEVVSHIGTLRRNASIFGCTVRAASLGGVATYAEHRGKGYATALFEETERACREDGVDFIIVSGYRKMYHRHGCRTVGRDFQFEVPRGKAGLLECGVDVAKARDEDATVFGEIYRREPVRWLRPPEDFTRSMHGTVMNRPAQFYRLGAPDGGEATAVLQLPRDENEKVMRVQEYAGDRRTLLGSLGAMMEGHGLEALQVHVGAWDAPARAMLEAKGLVGKQVASAGTVTLLSFAAFLDKLRPYFAEKVGVDAAASIVFEERDGARSIIYAGDRVVCGDRGEAAELIFGTPDGREEGRLSGGGKAAEVCRAIFPVPALWFGLNYM